MKIMYLIRILKFHVSVSEKTLTQNTQTMWTVGRPPLLSIYPTTRITGKVTTQISRLI